MPGRVNLAKNPWAREVQCSRGEPTPITLLNGHRITLGGRVLVRLAPLVFETQAYVHPS